MGMTYDGDVNGTMEVVTFCEEQDGERWGRSSKVGLCPSIAQLGVEAGSIRAIARLGVGSGYSTLTRSTLTWFHRDV